MTTTTPKNTFTSVPATGVMTGTNSWLPTSIVIQPSTTRPTTGGTQTTATGVPSYLPKAITPSTKPGDQPQDSTLIQLAYKYALNYPFIVEEPVAAAQMFYLVPKALGFALGLPEDKIVMHSLRPYDTTPQLGYITTLAVAYVPNKMVEKLRTDHENPNSPLYVNPDQLVSEMTGLINPSIDILYGSTLDGDGTTTGGQAPSNPSNNPNDAFGNGGSSSEQSSSQKGTTAAIALGAASVAGAYGAAMFIIARRYKRRKQRHQRSSSISSPSEMRQGQAGSPALMGGALLSRDFTAQGHNGYGGVGGGVPGNTRDSQGSRRSDMNNSGRTAFISAPVAAENSLGWN